MIELNEGSSITKTPLSLIMWKIASNVSFRFGICDIVLAENIKSIFEFLFNINFESFLFQKLG